LFQVVVELGEAEFDWVELRAVRREVYQPHSHFLKKPADLAA
jgi:hypothetical protein